MRFPSWYAWLAVVLSVVASVGLNVLITVNLAERAREGQRVATCEIVRTQVAIYRATPPSTPTGQEAQRAWELAYSRWRCDQISETR